MHVGLRAAIETSSPFQKTQNFKNFGVCFLSLVKVLNVWRQDI